MKQITDYATTFRHQQIGVLVPNLNVMTKYLNRLASGLPDGIPLQHYKSDATVEVDFTSPESQSSTGRVRRVSSSTSCSSPSCKSWVATSRTQRS